MKRFSLSLLAASVALGLTAHSASAQNLGSLYEAARTYDATFLSAKALFDSNVALADQARASLLPTIGFSSTISRTDFKVTFGRGQLLPHSGFLCTNQDQAVFAR